VTTATAPGPHRDGGDLVRRLFEFLDSSPTAYQAAAEATRRLDSAGFRKLDEREAWSLERGAGYYLMRNDSTVVAFTVGTDPVESSGFRIVTAHTDSPSFKVKRGSESAKNGLLRMSVEVYGGPIYSTWLDRELSIAGIVTLAGPDGLRRRLYASAAPTAIIPNAAIHLNREMNKGFAYNPQDHLKPVIAGLTGDHPKLEEWVGKELGVEADSILDYDLYLADRTPASYVGFDRGLIASGRLDNLAMCSAALEALVSSAPTAHTRLAVLFDNEEVGSRTWQGADGALLRDVLERVVIADGAAERESLFRALARSVMLSGDAAHGVHPSYADKHDEHFTPTLNGGPVIKISAGQRYTTVAHTAALFELECRERAVPVQRIIARSDNASGSTVGPVVSSRLGVPSLDIGHPILAMHSLRETGGAKDHPFVVEALRGFYESSREWR
jgi:aspartyl aminopeptidase